MLIIDMHNDTAFKYYEDHKTLSSPSSTDEDHKRDVCFLCHEPLESNYHMSLKKMKQGGLNLAFFAAFCTFHDGNTNPNEVQLAMIDSVLDAISHHKDELVLGLDRLRITRELEAHKVVAMLSLEGLYGIACEEDLKWLDHFYARGVRLIAPVWNDDNALCAGTYGSGSGVSDLGLKALERMGQLGFLLDVSHMHPSAVEMCLKHWKGPLVASHSGAYGVTPHPRNLSDEHIRGVAHSGGVVSVPFYGEFLKRQADSTGNLLDLIAHIDYIISLVGDDFIGLGSDFDGCTPISELSDVTALPNLITALKAFGYTEQRIEKIMGLNNLRVVSTLL
jgi:membrane dipeptidase